MLAFVFFLLLVAVILGAVGLLVKGLLWLLFIGVALAIIGLVFGGYHGGRRRRRRVS